jgi:hypothetical protein
LEAELQVDCQILVMNPEQLAHLDRIAALVELLSSIAWIESREMEGISLRLRSK